VKEKKFIFSSIKFYDRNFLYLLNKLTSQGGYMVAPAASSLCDIKKDKIYHKSLINSKFAIFDSGFFCLLIRIFRFKKVNKFSGYLFLKTLLEKPSIKNQKFFLINPSKYEESKNKIFLIKKGIKYSHSYISPKYNRSNYKDKQLLNEIKSYNPKFIIINIGGGIQEPLANYLYLKLQNRNKFVSIFCTGAAIGFLTGTQAPINDFYDKYYLGWLIRLFFRPKSYLPRITKSFKLLKYFFNY